MFNDLVLPMNPSITTIATLLIGVSDCIDGDGRGVDAALEDGEDPADSVRILFFSSPQLP